MTVCPCACQNQIEYPIIREYRLKNDIKYVLNPAADVDLIEIRGALVSYRGYGDYFDYGPDYELPLDQLGYAGVRDGDTRRTEFLNFGCLTQYPFRVVNSGGIVNPFAYQFRVGTDDNNIYLRVAAKVRPKNPSFVGDDIVISVPFKVKVTRSYTQQPRVNISNDWCSPTISSFVHASIDPVSTNCARVVLPVTNATTIQAICNSNNYQNRAFPVARTAQDEVELRKIQEEEHQIELELKLFPNPTSDKVLVQTSGRDLPKAIEIFNILGQNMAGEVGVSYVDQKDVIITEIDLSKLPNGQYLIVFDFGGKSTARKIIKMSK